MMLVAYDFSTFGLGWGVALHNGNGIIDFLLFFFPYIRGWTLPTTEMHGIGVPDIKRALEISLLHSYYALFSSTTLLRLHRWRFCHATRKSKLGKLRVTRGSPVF